MKSIDEYKSDQRILQNLIRILRSNPPRSLFELSDHVDLTVYIFSESQPNDGIVSEVKDHLEVLLAKSKSISDSYKNTPLFLSTKDLLPLSADKSQKISFPLSVFREGGRRIRRGPIEQKIKDSLKRINKL
jgi:hypothetical protein